MPSLRHVLIICYDFPRISRAGVIRTYQLAKRLPEFGWEPVILTAQECGRKCQDNIEISDGQLSCPKATAKQMRVLAPFQIQGGKSRLSLNGAVPEADGRIRRLMSIAGRFPVPDGKIGWLLPAVRHGVQISHDYPIEACLSVSPRPTAHLVAYRLARRLEIPWVADFALPWSDAYWLAGRPRVIDALDKRLEKLVVRSAQHVTVAYPDIGRGLRARYGQACGDRITVVPTGFDEDMFTEHHPAVPAKFTVVHPGNHFCEEGRDGEYFLQAIDEWIDLNRGLEEKVEFVFIGKQDDDLLRHRRNMAHPKVVRVEPLMSHRTCIQAIRSSHLCVVNAVGNRIPAKTYECMRAGKWILALTEPDSDLDGLVRGYPKGISIPARDNAAVMRVFERLHRERSPTPTPAYEAVQSLYSSRQSAQSLARLLDTALIARKGRRESGSSTGYRLPL